MLPFYTLTKKISRTIVDPAGRKEPEVTGRHRQSLDERIRDILNDETTDCDVLKHTTPAPKLLEGLPEKLSSIPKTPISKRVEPEEKGRIEWATFNTARDSLLWFVTLQSCIRRHMSCEPNICDALKRKFGCRNAIESTLQEIAAVNLQSKL